MVPRSFRVARGPLELRVSADRKARCQGSFLRLQRSTARRLHGGRARKAERPVGCPKFRDEGKQSTTAFCRDWCTPQSDAGVLGAPGKSVADGLRRAHRRILPSRLKKINALPPHRPTQKATPTSAPQSTNRVTRCRASRLEVLCSGSSRCEEHTLSFCFDGRPLPIFGF